MTNTAQDLVFFEGVADWLFESKGNGLLVGGRLRLATSGLWFAAANPAAPSMQVPLETLGASRIEGASGLRLERQGNDSMTFVMADPKAFVRALDQARRWQKTGGVYRR